MRGFLLVDCNFFTRLTNHNEYSKNNKSFSLVMFYLNGFEFRPSFSGDTVYNVHVGNVDSNKFIE